MQTVNFDFLKPYDPLLVTLAASAERYFAGDPNTCLVKLRQFGEALCRQTAARVGMFVSSQDDFGQLINRLSSDGVLDPQMCSLFHGLRKSGNIAVHQYLGTHSEALHQLKMAREVSVWFHRTFGPNRQFTPGAFIPPPNPDAQNQQLSVELETLKKQLSESLAQLQDTDQRRLDAETAAARYQTDSATWQALAEEMERQAEQERARFEGALAVLHEQATTTPGATQDLIQRAKAAAQKIELNEADTRRLIDEQLRQAGWEADSQTLTYLHGLRPQKGRNLAIAEFPTANGPCDYALFCGLTPVGVVEAKRWSVDVAASVEQAKRYSRGFALPAGCLAPGGPWETLQVPFLYATNGRPYLKQLETKSGIWFLDGRSKHNTARALAGWHSPAGLLHLLETSREEADAALKAADTDYLPLRPYQHQAIQSIEAALATGQRNILVAMATGTGKTRTCICLMYRLLKAKRFRRILFLVDRTALGDQTTDELKTIQLENLQTFTQIYDLKELGDLLPEPDTRLQIATVHAMMRRLFNPTEDRPTPPVDQYDCIVVDECHRGYALDSELSDTELTYRDEAEYISKYRRVLDHFDAVKIGLTATPALHTTEIFGMPVVTYNYRQAVIDDYLVDHEEPIRIRTRLADDGIIWKPGEEVKLYDPESGQLDLFTAPDEIEADIEAFNRRVVTEAFNRVVCTELARQIDPTLREKTLVYCATDNHADMVVSLLKAAFAEHYGEIEDAAVRKITGKADQPRQLIRTFKNERLPSVAVTVDLLTTGIDVPEITNLVFIRRVKSRILYEQMLGRATRRCDEISKTHFRIYDAVALYNTMQPFTDMKPVVKRPNITMEQLVRELAEAPTPAAQADLLEQIRAKAQAKKRRLSPEQREAVEALAGCPVETLLTSLGSMTPGEASRWFSDHPDLPRLLDLKSLTEGRKLLISEHPDELTAVERGYGAGNQRPESYLEAFSSFIREHLNQVPALVVVTQRPRELTRAQLRELKLVLDQHGFSEINLQTAWRETTNQDIAASIIGFIRNRALGEPLTPYGERVDLAVKRILASRSWTNPQRKWLERIAKQIKVEIIVDRDSFEQGAFKAEGGFTRINKVFDGHLEDILDDMKDGLWQESA